MVSSEVQASIGIVVVYLALMFLLAFVSYRRRETGDIDEYFIMGRELTPIIGMLTMFATFQSGFFMFGAPGVFYALGFPFMVALLIEVPLITVFIWFFGARIWVMGKKYGHYTVTRLFGHYYDSTGVRLAIVAMTVVFLILYIDVQLIAGGLALESVTQGLISYEVGVVLMGILVAGYTLLGGFRAVTWTDSVQGFLFFAGVWVLAVWFLVRHGGVGGFFGDLVAEYPNALSRGGFAGIPIQTFIWTNLAFVFGAIVTFPVLPMFTRRIMAAEDLPSLRKMAVGAGGISLVGFVGLVILAFGIKMAMPGIQDTDAVVPTFVTDTFPILGAAYISAAIAAMMSTSDSLLITTASTVVDDFYRPQVRPEASGTHLERIAWATIVAVIAVAIVIGTIRPGFIVGITFVALGGFIPLVWALFGMLFWRGATSEGVLASIVVSTALIFWIKYLGAPVPRFTSGFDFLLYAFPISLLVFVGVSLVTSGTAPEENVETAQQLFQDYLP
ncbi:MAG: sodium:solute symporter [Haloarculaceae archaeon]